MNERKIDLDLEHFRKANVRDDIVADIFEGVLHNITQDIVEEQLGLREAAQRKTMTIFAKALQSNRSLEHYQGQQIAQKLTDMEIARFNEEKDDIRVINHREFQLEGRGRQRPVPQLEAIKYSQKQQQKQIQKRVQQMLLKRMQQSSQRKSQQQSGRRSPADQPGASPDRRRPRDSAAASSA